ncbi:MAG: ATP-binding protein [Planctomycetota bacterium]
MPAEESIPAVGPLSGPLARAASGSGDGYWEWCVAEDTVWYSDALLGLLGYEPGQIASAFADFLDLIHPADREALKSRLAAAANDSGGCELDFRALVASAGARWFRLSASPCFDDAGRAAFLSGVWRDVTDERTTAAELDAKEQEFKQKQRMDALDCLAGGIAHEFNNVLQAVRGYVSFAQDELADGSQARADLDQALMATDRAAALTRSLLDFARAKEEVIERYDIREIIFGLRDLLRPVIGEDIDLKTHTGNRPLFCEADSQGLRQSLLNLCINARDAMPDGGELLVAARPVEVDDVTRRATPGLAAGHYAKIQVTDSGSGIPPEVVERVFDPFFSTKEVGRGTGLGLATVYGFVNRSGGGIAVHSESGRGSTFSLYLPIEEVHGMSNSESSPDLCAGEGQVVLLVEDDPQVREVGERSLRLAGYEVLTADDGEAGLELFIENAGRVDLVILDSVLPRLSGRRVFEDIRRLQSEVPVIFVTGFDPVSSIGASSGPMADAVIAKPYDRSELLSEVKSLVDTRRVRACAAGSA